MPKNLTQKQEAFARHFALHGNAIEAYKAAGYSWKNMKPETLRVKAAELVAHGTVSVRIAEFKAKKEKRLEKQFDVTVDRIVQELAAIGFSNMEDYIRTTDEGDAFVDFRNLTRQKAAAITEITVEEYVEGRGDDSRNVKRTKFKLADKRGALVDLGKHLGMFERDNSQRKNNINIVSNAAADFDSRIAGVLARTSETGRSQLPN